MYPGYGAYPGYPAQPPAKKRRGVRTGIAIAVAAIVLAGVGVGVTVVARDDGNGSGNDRAVSPQQTQGGPGGGEGGPQDPFGGNGGGGNGGGGGIGGGSGGGGNGGGGNGGGSGGQDGQSPGPRQSEPPKIESGSVPDAVSGISMPVPEGWYGQELSVGAQLSSKQSYKCPGDTSATCTKGGAYSAPAMVLGTKGDTAEEVAKADIAANAEESYGGKSYGSITSHEVLSSKAVTVAGQKGYQVRWKAVTSKGADGYVESLAFPSPADPDRIVVVRFGVDVGEKQSVIDEITKGIKVSSGGTGSGQDV
ncbi:hypothetical protein [Streptomyces sp. NPDC000134]|uniref:hypothetical protein n=1 Tax=Streptomyces sp. NPDC000134 TaxID=3364536 RepID=UPI00368A9B89